MSGQIPTGAEKIKLIQQQLVFLLHANKCSMMEATKPNAPKCTLRYCKIMKEVLIHMTTCRANGNCTSPNCWSSRQILGHWKSCIDFDCSVCLQFKPIQFRNDASSQDEIVIVTDPLRKT